MILIEPGGEGLSYMNSTAALAIDGSTEAAKNQK
jgi:hypothetical protein